MRIRTLGIIGLVMALLSVGVPYLFLRDIARFSASYLFWTVLTIVIIVIGFIHLTEWGTNK